MKRFDVRDLELRHNALDFAIHELDRRGEHMTPAEHQRAAELKKQRLATKDQLYALGRR
ncbi:MAG: YdcH family protein [Polyangiaceae bacterium]